MQWGIVARVDTTRGTCLIYSITITPMTEFHALVPAAGFGARMGNELPKQYMPLAGRPMIAHALDTLCSSPDIATVFVVLTPDDKLFHGYDWTVFGD